MTNQEATRRLKIVIEETIVFLAKKHGTTTDMVIQGLQAGHKNLSKQFEELMAVGGKAAAEA